MEEQKKLMEFVIEGNGFRIDYIKEGTKNCKDDKYWLYHIKNKKEKGFIALREDECILLSALLSFSVHKKLVEIDKIGCGSKKKVVIK